MVSLAQLESAAPTIAAFVADKIAATGLCLLGTLRSDGWPRVSPLEVFVHGGQIYMGSMPGAVKALDLQRTGAVGPSVELDLFTGQASRRRAWWW